MNLLFVTRKLHRGDARTGFVFSWLEQLASKVSRLSVICLEKGDAAGLPKNVRVFSMGKEQGAGRLRELWNYLGLLFRLVPQTDGIFIHMHPVYVIAAWLPSRIFGKKLILWYTHKSVDLKLKLAHRLVDEVVTASPESFRIRSTKVKVLGHGIDLEKFRPVGQKPSAHFRIVSVGRLSPVKDYETLIKAIELLQSRGITDLRVAIYGGAALPADRTYLDSLVTFVHNGDLEEVVKFAGEANYEFVQQCYQEADLSINLSQTGSIDKSVLEAAACGALILTSNEAFRERLSKISPGLVFSRNDHEDLAEKILHLKALPTEARQSLGAKLRAWVAAEHNLASLVEKIIQEFGR